MDSIDINNYYDWQLFTKRVMRLNRKQKRKIRREVELDLDFISPKSAIYRNKKKYYRKVKHKKNE